MAIRIQTIALGNRVAIIISTSSMAVTITSIMAAHLLRFVIGKAIAEFKVKSKFTSRLIMAGKCCYFIYS